MGETSTDLGVPSECRGRLYQAWSGDAVWDWHALLQNESEDVQNQQSPVADQAASIMEEGFSVDDPNGVDVDRHAIAILASATVAASRGRNYVVTHGSQQQWGLGDGCELMENYARCAMVDFTEPSACTPAPTLSPPPAGDDPEDFCGEVFGVGANGSVAFNCTATPLSNTLTYITTREAEQTNSRWLTVTSADLSKPQMVWWPVFLAALSASAPSLVLFTLASGETGVLSVHEIGVQVEGKKEDVVLFEDWLAWQGGASGVEPAVPFKDLKFTIPSKLKYRAYPTMDDDELEEFTNVPLVEWKANDGLQLAGGVRAQPAFTKLVGIIDPCRDLGGPEPDAQRELCTNRAAAWNSIGTQLVEDEHTTFDEPLCPTTDE